MKEERGKRINDRPEQQARHEQTPQRRGGREKPTGEQEPNDRHRNEAATEVVENFPLVENGKGIAIVAAVAAGNARFQPVDDLPVAAHPAVLPIPPRDVTGWKNIEQLNISRQGYPDVAAFQQVM